jgi:phosphatidylinositol alpha-1,6-mannosyltransferase
VLLTVGRLDSRERYKGYDRLIAAIPELVARGHDVCYLIVGAGDDRSRPEDLADGLGVSDRVRFLGAGCCGEPSGNLQQRRSICDAVDGRRLRGRVSGGNGLRYAGLGFAAAGACDALVDGELGTMTSESELVTTTSRLLLQPKPDSKKLHAAICARFVRDQFAANASAALQRLAEQAVVSTFP